MSMSKRVRKGISLLASFAMGAGLMIGTFAAPAAAVADSVTIDTAGGIRNEVTYRDELHGQVCDFWYNYGNDFDYTYANEGVFINGTFAGPNAGEMELVDVTLIDLPATSDNDLLELDWVDFNRYDRAGVEGWDEDAEMEDCSSDHDFEVFMADDSNADSEFTYWDVAGNYTYRLSFANSFGGNGTVTLTQDVVITVAGDVADLDLVLEGDETSVTWPVQTDYFGDMVSATLTFLDANGNVTHPSYGESSLPETYFYYDEGDGYWSEEIYQTDWLNGDWGEEVWIMSNDWETGDYLIHDQESDASEYSEAHANESGFGFNYTSAYFEVPVSHEGEYVVGEDYHSSQDDLGGDEIAVNGLVDSLGDFTGGIEIEFFAGSDVAEVSNFWVRLADGDDGAPIDSNTVSIDFREWVDPDTLGANTNLVAKTGVAIPGECFESDWFSWGNECGNGEELPSEGSNYTDLAAVRTDAGSFQSVYNGGTANAGKFIAVESNDLSLTHSATYALSIFGYDVALTDAAGVLTTTASVAGETKGYYGSYNCDALCYESWDAADEYDYYGTGASFVDIILEAKGFWPEAKLQSTSSFAKYQPNAYSPAYWWYTQWHKSVLFESTQTMTFKVTDIWGDVIADAGMYLSYTCWGLPSDYCAEFAEYDDFEVTNSSGLVTYTVENIDDPADVVSRHEGQDDCDVVANCQEALEDIQGNPANYFTDAVFYVTPSNTYLSQFFDTWYHVSDRVMLEFVRSVSVDDIYLEVCGENIGGCDDEYDGTGDNAIHIDTEGDESEDLYLWTLPLNADGVVLVGLPYSISGTEGSYVSGICDERGIGYVENWWPYDFAWGCFSYVDYMWDVSEMSDGISGTASPRSLEAYVTGTLVGTSTYTVTFGGVSESFDQDYYNLVEDARYISAVATDAANVIAGNIATATFKVTDRFGNAVEDVDVVFSENGLGEFLSNDPAATSGVTDANGVVSVDLLTPENSMAQSAVTAEFETMQDPAANTAFGITAAVESADATITWTHITPTIDVKALKYRAGIKVFVQNAVGNITRVYVDGKMKRIFVPATVNGFEKILLKKGGKRTVVVTVASPLGNIFETFELKIKKNK